MGTFIRCRIDPVAFADLQDQFDRHSGNAQPVAGAVERMALNIMPYISASSSCS
jgi:hypothetical protein